MEYWLIYREEDIEKNGAYIDNYVRLSPKYGFECKVVRSSEIHVGIKDNNITIIAPSAIPKFAVVRSIDTDLTSALEKCGVRCFNNSTVSRICNNKAYTYSFLTGMNIPMPNACFVRGKDLAGYLEKCPKGRVVKSVAGHGGAEVMLFDGDIDAVIKRMHGSDVVVQDRIGKKARDLRVYCVGKHILASVLRESDDDFRANFSLGGRASLYELKKDEEALVRRILHKLPSDLVGIDFLLDEDGKLIFNEIEDVVGARMLYSCSDIDIVDVYLKYINGFEGNRMF